MSTRNRARFALIALVTLTSAVGFSAYRVIQLGDGLSFGDPEAFTDGVGAFSFWVAFGGAGMVIAALGSRILWVIPAIAGTLDRSGDPISAALLLLPAAIIAWPRLRSAASVPPIDRWRVWAVVALGLVFVGAVALHVGSGGAGPGLEPVVMFGTGVIVGMRRPLFPWVHVVLAAAAPGLGSVVASLAAWGVDPEAIAFDAWIAMGTTWGPLGAILLGALTDPVAHLLRARATGGLAEGTTT